MSKSAIRAGDRAFVKVGRNLVEVRVDEKAEGGWGDSPEREEVKVWEKSRRRR